LQGVAIAERATQHAITYARDRVQGGKPIIEHADVKRMLLTMQAYTQAGRIMAYEAAFAIDTHQKNIVELMTPIVKSWCTDRAVDVTSLGVQVHGGMGFVEETGAAQYYRDARILPIYEGTNGIQAADLVIRKIVKDQGAAIIAWMNAQKEILSALDQSHGTDMSQINECLNEAFDALKGATGILLAAGQNNEVENIAGVSHLYLTLAGNVMAGIALAKAALKARALISTNTYTDYSTEFLNSKIMTARFFADHILPQCAGLAHTVRHGHTSIMKAVII
jgi:hypothetical protein